MSQQPPSPLPPDISLFEMDLFVRASRLRSLRELARQLALKPAHVSKVIKRLEAKLGTPLLKRSVSGVLLTPEGTQLLRVAEEICELSGQLPSQERRMARSHERIWSIGSISFLCREFLVPALTPLTSENTNYRFRYVEFTTNELVASGLNGAFEIAVHIEPLQWTRAWLSRRLGSLRWALYARYGHPLHAASETEVLKYRFVLPTGWTAQGFAIGEDHCPVSWRDRKGGDEASTPGTALEILAHSDQLAFLPEVMTRKAVAAGRIAEIPVEGWPAVHKDLYLSARTDVVSKHFYLTLIEALQSAMKPIAPCLFGFLTCA
jgi:DNA-binding transcriptional LysR family regulator